MSTTEYELDRSLAIRVAKSPNFRWSPGMQTRDGDRVLMISGNADFPKIARWRMSESKPPFMGAILWKFDDIGQEALPDLSDAATIGCLVSLVRETAEDPAAYIERRNKEGDAYCALWVNGREIEGNSEAEVIAKALELSVYN